MATTSKFIALSPVHVSTTVNQTWSDAGQRGVIYINKSDHDGLETFRYLDQLEASYDVDDPIWDQGNAYFKGAPDGQVQVLSVDQNGTLFATPAGAPTVSTDTNSNSVTVTDNPTPTGATPTFAELVIDRLYKYYGAGFQYVVYPVTKDTQDVAIALSNFIEAQDLGYLFLDTTTDSTKTLDFSWLDVIKDNRATKVVSLPDVLDKNSVLASEALGKYVQLPIGSNLNFLDNFTEVQPQDQYEFNAQDLAEYVKYNIGTYYYDPDTPLFSNGRSLSGVSTGIMIYKDYLSRTISSRVRDYLIKNKPPYNASTVKAIISIIQGVLTEAVAASKIEDYDIPDFDADALSDEIKATGKLTGVTWSYKPMRFIDEAWFQQGLELTVLE